MKIPEIMGNTNRLPDDRPEYNVEPVGVADGIVTLFPKKKVIPEGHKKGQVFQYQMDI